MDKNYLKLRDILNIFDGLSDICIWLDGTSDDDEPQYRGVAMDCPFWLSELFLYKGLDDDYCALSVRKDDDEHNTALLIVSVTEDKTKALCKTL